MVVCIDESRTEDLVRAVNDLPMGRCRDARLYLLDFVAFNEHIGFDRLYIVYDIVSKDCAAL